MKSLLRFFPSLARRLAVPAPSFLLFALVFALFSPSIRYDFVDFDDPAYIVGNTLVHSGLAFSSLCGAFATTPADVGMYMPLLWISYMADVSFFGASIDNPAPFHAVNVAFHAANAVLFFFLLLHLSRFLGPPSSRIRSPKPGILSAFLLSLLWAVHPLRVESVAWITERKDVLSLFFALLALLAYLRAHSPRGQQGATPSSLAHRKPGSKNRSSTIRLLFSALSFLFAAAALLVKPTLVPFPLLLVAIDLLVLRTPVSLRLIFSKTHFFLLSAAVALATLIGHNSHLLYHVSVAARLARLPQILSHYLSLSLFPIHLTLLDPRPDFAIIPAFLDAVLIAVLLFLAVRLRRRMPAAALGIFWFFLFLLPVSGLATIPNNAVADRFSYVPALGISIALCPLRPFSPQWGLAGQEKGTPRVFQGCCVFLVALCALFAILSLRVLPHWRSSDALYGRIRRFSPLNAFVALHDAKSAIAASGDFQTAFDAARASFEAHPFSQPLVGILSACIAELDGPLAAIDYLAAHPAVPGHLRAEWAWRMARLSLRVGRPSEALGFAAIADENLPVQDTLRANIQRLRVAATSHDPADALPHYISQWMTYERSDALEFFRRFVAAYPSRPDILANVAWILSTSDWSPAPPSEPLGYASRALALAPDPPPPELLDTVAAAQANASDFASAVSNQERAVSLLPPISPSLSDYQARLALYRISKPYRHDIGRPW